MSVVTLPPEAMFMCIVHTAAMAMLESVVHVAARSHVDVPDPAVAGAMLMSVAHDTTKGHGDVRGSCCHLKPR